MGSVEVALGSRTREDEPLKPRKRFKISELPLNGNQRSAIDGILHKFKKEGAYDALRKKIFSQFAESDAKKGFTDRLDELADAETDRDPSLLSRDRGKAVMLMHGAVDRSDIYKSVELSLDNLIAEHMDRVLAASRVIRKKDVGEDVAAEEERRGNKTDEEYEKEAAVRREAREQARKQEEARKRREEEKEKLRAEAIAKQAELDKLRRREERRKEALAREAKREEERKRRAQEEQERQQRYEEEEIEREKSRQRSQDRVASSHLSSERPNRTIVQSSRTSHSRAREDSGSRIKEETSSRIKEEPKEEHHDGVNGGSTEATATAPQIDEKAIEEAALEELLRESRELAAKSSHRSQIERSESLEPPHRKTQMLKTRSSNISPSKFNGSRTPLKSEPFKPKLSFSATNLGLDPSTPKDASPRVHTRSKSPGHHQHRHDRSISHSRYEEEYRTTREFEDKANYKARMSSQRETEAEAYKRASREYSYQSQSAARDETREKDVSKNYDLEDTRERDYRHSRHQNDYEQRGHRSSRYSRSRSPTPRDRDGHRERDYDRERHRNDRDRHRDDRHHYDDRPGSGHHVVDSKYKYDDGRGIRSGHGHRPRDKSPVDIDRYMPSGGRSRPKDDGRDRERGRDRDRRSSVFEERDRGLEERDRGFEERVRRHDGRDKDHDERHRDYDRRDRGYDGRDRDRDRRDDGRERDRERDRRDDGRDRRSDGRDWERGRDHPIDRYMPRSSGGGDDLKRSRGRDRSY